MTNVRPVGGGVQGRGVRRRFGSGCAVCLVAPAESRDVSEPRAASSRRFGSAPIRDGTQGSLDSLVGANHVLTFRFGFGNGVWAGVGFGFGTKVALQLPSIRCCEVRALGTPARLSQPCR